MDFPDLTAESFERDFRVLREIGRGRFGEAMLVDHVASGDKYALKRTKFGLRGQPDAKKVLVEAEDAWVTADGSSGEPGRRREAAARARLTFVSLGADGKTRPLPALAPVTARERHRFEMGRRRYAARKAARRRRKQTPPSQQQLQ